MPGGDTDGPFAQYDTTTTITHTFRERLDAFVEEHLQTRQEPRDHPADIWGAHVRPCLCCGSRIGRTEREGAVPVNINEGPAYVCVECSEDDLIFCPVCRVYYKVDEVWPDADFPTGELNTHRNVAPCPEHSIDDDQPLYQCDGCQSTIAPYDKVTSTNARRAYCWECTEAEGKYFCVECNLYYLTNDPDYEVGRETCAGEGCIPPNVPAEIRAGYGITTPEAMEQWNVIEDCECTICTTARDRYDREDDAGGAQHITCDNCKGPVDIAGGIRSHRGDFCILCIDRYLPACDECGDRTADNYSHVYDVGNLCEGCMEGKNIERCTTRCNQLYLIGGDCECGGLNPYNYRPPMQIFTLPPERARPPNPTIGFELEVEATHDNATKRGGKALLEDYAYLYDNHDGTLENGMEIVSHPFTYSWFDEHYPEISSLLMRFMSEGFRAFDTDTCGMHVHVGKDGMSKTHQLKVNKLIYDYPGLSMTIGQRDRSTKGITKFASFTREDLSRMVKKVRDETNLGQDHYVAVNMEKATTIEARFFRATLRPSSFRKNIEFMVAAWEFTRKAGITSTNEYNFIRWLSDRHDRFPYLVDYLAENYADYL